MGCIYLSIPRYCTGFCHWSVLKWILKEVASNPDYATLVNSYIYVYIWYTYKTAWDSDTVDCYHTCVHSCTSVEARGIILSVVHPSACPLDLVNLSFFSNLGPVCICWRNHWKNGLKFGILMYPDHFQNWLNLDHGLLIFLIWGQCWLSEEGKIWDFQAFHGEHMEEIRRVETYFWCFALSFV